MGEEEWICDDRNVYEETKKILEMTDEEFAEYYKNKYGKDFS